MYGMNNMEAIPKFDIKSVIRFDIRFDISIEQTTWIGHKSIFVFNPYTNAVLTLYTGMHT